MIKTTPMRFIELMVYREDIGSVLKYLSDVGEFQFQDEINSSSDGRDTKAFNPYMEVFAQLQDVRIALGLEDLDSFKGEVELPTEDDLNSVSVLKQEVEELHKKELRVRDELQSIGNACNEALAFSNLKVPYSQLESLSFLTLRIGKINPNDFEKLKFALGNKAIVAKLGDDGSRILVSCSKKSRFFVDDELKKIDFVKVEIPKDFTGVPDDAIQKLNQEKLAKEKELDDILEERANFSLTHEDLIYSLLQKYSFASQIRVVENTLESTSYVYKVTGWLPAYLIKEVMRHVDDMTSGRSGIRNFMPDEVASVIEGREKVPVALKHGKLVDNFKRMIFSYGSPLYGTVDPTPFVAIFFTLLFGIMFGDAGQGLVFLIVGILMTKKIIKLGGWEKFNLIFIAIGISSTIMGLLTGEFFANAELLKPFSRFVTGLFGERRDHILEMMPSGDAESIKKMFLFFGFTVGVGFIINTVGLIINIVNQFSLKRTGRALFGKTGLAGAIFFWYVIAFGLRIAFFGHKPAIYDWCILGLTLMLAAFGEPLERLVEGHRPVFENGLFAGIIGAVVEIIEILSSYLSNTVSFLRVGAFALAHAVLGFIIEMLAEVTPFPFSILVFIIGNVIVVVLEGMIVAIQVVRLQYYEFFSKFFTETGREFKPFKIMYGGQK